MMLKINKLLFVLIWLNLRECLHSAKIITATLKRHIENEKLNIEDIVHNLELFTAEGAIKKEKKGREEIYDL